MSVHPLDAADPLAPFRARFYLPPGAPIYLDGNSLGLLSVDAEASVLRVLHEWKTLAIGGWLDGVPAVVHAGRGTSRRALARNSSA